MVEENNIKTSELIFKRLKSPWVWLAFVTTLGMTALFYVSQKTQVPLYAQYMKTMSEYQYAETMLMRSMERVRMGSSVDSSVVIAQTITVSEMAVSFSADVHKLEASHNAVPQIEDVERFEKKVLGKISSMRRYLSARMAWQSEYAKVGARLKGLEYPWISEVWLKLDSARAGVPVVLESLDGVPDSLAADVRRLLQDNVELCAAWSNFDNDVTLASSDEFLHFFQLQNMNEMVLKSKIPMFFYFFALVLLLSTFFYMFRFRQ